VITLTRRFWFFGEYRLRNATCDVCGLLIQPSGVFVGQCSWTDSHGISFSNQIQAHEQCASQLSLAEQLATHEFEKSFDRTKGILSLPNWEVGPNRGQSYRDLDGYFYDTGDRVLKRIDQCALCKSVLIQRLRYDDRADTPEFEYRSICDSKALSKSCVSHHFSDEGRTSLMRNDCSHEFQVLGRTEQPSLRIVEWESLPAYEKSLQSYFGIGAKEYREAQEEERDGTMFHWCQKCGYLVETFNFGDRMLPTLELATHLYGKTWKVTQRCIDGTCAIDDFERFRPLS